MFYQYDVRPPPSFTHSANLSGMFRKYGRSSASVRAFPWSTFGEVVDVPMLGLLQDPPLDGVLTDFQEMPDQTIAVHVPVVDDTLPPTFDGERTSSLPC